MRGQRVLGPIRIFFQLTLLQRFTVLGVAVTFSLAILFSQILSDRMIADALNDSARAASIATSLVTPQVTAEDFNDPIREKVAAWQQRVGEVVGKINVVRIEVWRPDGTVVYSDERTLIGRKFKLSDELREALGGRVTKEVTGLEKQEETNARPYGKLLKVYVPMILPGYARPVGAYEVHQTFTSIQARINSIRKTVWGGSFIVFSLLFASLYALVRSASRQLHYMAYHDPLTGLANRRLLHERAEQALTVARRYGRIVGLLYLDLARFKAVNDTLGHTAGDELLKKVSHRLSNGLRESDTLIRLGGDEFAIFLTEVQRKEDAAHVAQRVLESLQLSFWLKGQPVHIGGNLGITLYPEDGTTFEELMKHADIAMYRAKADGTGFKFYQPQLDVYSQDRLLLETELRAALEQHQFVLYYQPVVDLKSERTIGVEALIRWPHPRRGLVPADDFIPLAEESDLILHLDRWTLATATRQAQAWVSRGWDGWMAVNLSARSLGNPQLPEYVDQILKKEGLPACHLMLEITESAAMRDPEVTIHLLKQLNTLGISVAVDDFGLGYSSLAYLKHFPVHQLKIDRSFVQGIGTDKRDEQLVEAMITLTRGLGVKVLAEGVERADQVAWLREQGCGLAQGFLVGHPVPPEELLKHLQKETRVSPLA
jgi:diguanylate cyclase (GGDEF)-like protein